MQERDIDLAITGGFEYILNVSGQNGWNFGGSWTIRFDFPHSKDKE